MAAASERARGLHARGVSAKQRLHFAALLIFFAALPLSAQIEFDPTTTQQQFETFSRLVGQGIYASPVDPARATGFLGFDVGIAATALQVDTSADYWNAATNADVTVGDYLVVPRLVVRKGISKATISASYAKVPDLDVQVWGAGLDIPIIDGGLIKPTLALRGTYATLRGVDAFDAKTYGAEIFLSKGIGPVTPYAAIGRMRVDSSGTISTVGTASRTLHDQVDMNRVTVGVRLSLLVPKIVIEATQADERVYSAKISFGL
jgi:hypothetical protein